MKETHPKKIKDRPEMLVTKQIGWAIFTPEMSWFIYDFFKHDLNGYEKLMFYSYYINGMTLEEIGEAACCSFQNIAITIDKINNKIARRWKNRDTWRVKVNDRD